MGCLRNLFLEFAELDGTNETRDSVGSGYRGLGAMVRNWGLTPSPMQAIGGCALQSNIIWLVSSKDHFGCCVENRMKGFRIKSREVREEVVAAVQVRGDDD